MKLLRWGAKGAEKPGAMDADGAIRDISSLTPDLFGQHVSIDALETLKSADLSNLPVVPADTRIGSCLAQVPNFFCVGLNYARHAAETGAEPPKEPILFSKATTALCGPYDQVIIPKYSEKTDWETELGVVIGAPAEHIAEKDVFDVISGYCLINDVSERAFQIERGGQWIKGKSAPTFGPTGPWLVTKDEIPNPQDLPMQLSVNGDLKQNSNTSDMIFSVVEIVSYMSRFMALQPGDIIATGTPEGVGMGQKPPHYLRPGDVMELSIEGLGAQRQNVVAFAG